MDNSFKPQGDFKSDGEFVPQGEFNAPEPPRQYVEVKPAMATLLPYEKGTKFALVIALIGLLLFAASIVMLVPSVLSKISNSTGFYIIFALISASALFYLIGILSSVKGVRAKYSKSIWSLVICCVLLILPLIILIYSAINGNIGQALLNVSKFMY
ncbi:MAG TPA: hypothetical protein VJZ69_05755 [Clostridia bacterium]|nr:hypothetical protein [Clostridia bacterium]